MTKPTSVTDKGKGDEVTMTCEVKSPDDMDASERPTISWTRDGSGLLPTTTTTDTRADQSESFKTDREFLTLQNAMI